MFTSKKTIFKLTFVNYLKYIANRWLSYARRLIGPILLIYLLPLAGNGPIWHYFEQLYAMPCKQNFLPSFLFTSNYASKLDDVVGITGNGLLTAI